MTTKSPAPVSAYAAVHNDKIIVGTVSNSEGQAEYWAKRDYKTPTMTPVTILPTEQYEAMVAALEWYGNAEMASGSRARAALAALKEQDHG